MHAQIRKATEADAVVIADLGKLTFTQTFEHLFTGYERELDEYLERTFSRAKIADSLQKSSNYFLLASGEGEPVGFAKLKLNNARPGFQPGFPPGFQPGFQPATQVQLQKIYVRQDWLSRKVGAALLEECLSVARRQGFGSVWLSVVESNARAIRFYERAGFSVVGHHTFTIGSQVFQFRCMQKNLTPVEASPA